MQYSSNPSRTSWRSTLNRNSSSHLDKVVRINTQFNLRGYLSTIYPILCNDSDEKVTLDIDLDLLRQSLWLRKTYRNSLTFYPKLVQEIIDQNFHPSKYLDWAVASKVDAILSRTGLIWWRNGVMVTLKSKWFQYLRKYIEDSARNAWYEWDNGSRKWKRQTNDKSS